MQRDRGVDSLFSQKEQTKTVQFKTSIEIPPAKGRNIFNDGKRHIDFVLAWDTKDTGDDKRLDKTNKREIFEKNLEKEGLEIERDITDERDTQYVKIHAPWEVLSRYAEIMKIRVPIEKNQDKIKSKGLREEIKPFLSKLLKPFQLDSKNVEPMQKKYTHPYESGKKYLFDIPPNKEQFFSDAIRSNIVDYILRHERYIEGTTETSERGIKRLLKDDVYAAAYPLHEGHWDPCKEQPSTRRLLYENWAHWKKTFKLQPHDYIREYFGEKIGLYFAWLGYYTYMLIFPSVVGLLVFLYGVWSLPDDTVSKETCDRNNNFTMCPECETRCPFWYYSSLCLNMQIRHTFDNGATVFLAVFMSLWGTIFLEFWKRKQVQIQYRWNTQSFEEEEEPPRPEYIVALRTSSFKRKHKVTRKEEPYFPYWRRRVPVYMASASSMLFFVTVVIAYVIGIYVYRMVMLFLLIQSDDERLYQNASMLTSVTAAFINLFFIFVLNRIYSIIAEKLTDWECLRTQSDYDSSLTFKLYVLKFVNFYSSLFYIAFIKGRFTGQPGDYNRLFFGARPEECQGGGCLTELVIQLVIIFVGKQFFQSTLKEILLPRICNKFRRHKAEEKKMDLMPWEEDHALEELGLRGLFDEYIEMMIQFGFVTIFVAAFPLAPIFALLNNFLEIRTDADKFITQLRRPIAQRAATIGSWYNILYMVSRLAILTNAFLIAFTTGFVHRFIYTSMYSPDGSLNGYVNWSLSYLNVSDFEPYEGAYNDSQICRYKDYREPPWAEHPYVYTTSYWHVLAAQLMFVVAFQNLVILCTAFVAYIIPDVPQKLSEQMRGEAYFINEIIHTEELKKEKSPAPEFDEQKERLRRGTLPDLEI